MTVTAPVTAVTPGPPGLSTRGRRLWRQVVDDGPALRPAELVLLEEACRIADRLDRIESILSGSDEGWMRLRVSDDGTEVTVTVDRVLAEARQQQVALKGLLAELRASRRESSGAPRRGQGGQARTSGTGAAVKGEGGGGGGVLVDLAARLAGRTG